MQQMQVFEAILRADLKFVTGLHEIQLELIRDKDGWHCLHFATLSIAMALGRSRDTPPDGKIPGIENAKAVFQLLIEQGCDVNRPNYSGVTCLHIAAWYGLTEVVDVLLRLRANVSAQANDLYKMRWYEAPHSGLKRLFKLDSDIYKPDTFCVGSEVTALYLAARAGHADVVRLLIKAGADVNTAKSFADQSGITALHAACAKGNKDVVVALLDSGCEVNPRASDGGTPLHCACEFGHEDIASLLINYKRAGKRLVDVNAKKACIEATNVSALHMAVAVSNENIVKQLLVAGCDVNARASDGFTPIHLAAQNGNIVVAQALLDYKCKLSPKASFEEYKDVSPLHLAVRQGDEAMVDLLLKAGADAFEVESVMEVNSITILHLAAMFGHVSLAKKFIELGLQPNSKTSIGITPLFLAVKEGHKEVVKLLLQATGGDVSVNLLAQQPEIGYVHTAVMRGHEDIVRLLAEAGCSVNQTIMSDNGGLITPLYLAVDKRSTSLVTTLLSLGANPDEDLRDGFTVMHTAAEQGYGDITEILASKGASTSKEATFGELTHVTPLHMAVMRGNVDVVCLLGKAGADMNAIQLVEGVPMTSLYVAVKNRDVAMMRALIDSKCDVNIKRRDGWTPFHLACEEGFTDGVKLMIDVGASVNSAANIEQNSNVQPLHQAAQEGYVDIVRLLINAGANVNAVKSWRGESGITALHLAAEASHVDVVELLLERGANVNCRKKNGWTPLHWAAQNGNVEIVQCLLNRRANVSATAAFDDHKLCQPIHQAAQYGRTSVLELLIKHGAKVDAVKSQGNTADITSFHLASAFGHTDSVRVLIAHGANVQMSDTSGFTALHFAAQNSHVDVCRLLLATNQCNLTKAGAAERCSGTLAIHSAATGGNVSILKFLAIAGSSLEAGRREGERSGIRPLHICAERGYSKAVAALLEMGVQIDATDSYGFTPLHLAASENHSDVIDVLAGAGANLNALATFHKERNVTPLHLASRFGHKKAVIILLQHGCNVNAAQRTENLDHCTALHNAAMEGHVSITHLLIKAGADVNLRLSNGQTAYELAQERKLIDVMKTIKYTKNTSKEI